MKGYSFDNKVKIQLKKLCIRECEKLNEDIIRSDEEGNLCEIDITQFGLFSPNFEDTEMIVVVRLGKLNMLFDPFSMNNLLKFFRYKNYVERGDIEGLFN